MIKMIFILNASKTLSYLLTIDTPCIRIVAFATDKCELDPEIINNRKTKKKILNQVLHKPSNTNFK